MISLEQFVEGLEQKPEATALILRHDVDIGDAAGNEAMLETEIRNGASATYYFRLSTAGVTRPCIRRMLAQGFQVGYHFEEAATVAKRRPCLRARTSSGTAKKSRPSSVGIATGFGRRGARTFGPWRHTETGSTADLALPTTN